MLRGVTALDVTAEPPSSPPSQLGRAEAEEYAGWFATLADPTRVRVLHAVATSPAGHLRVGDVATTLGISQPTATHHVQRLEEVGFVRVDKVGTAKQVSVNPACCTGLPHAADIVMGTAAHVRLDFTMECMTVLASSLQVYRRRQPNSTFRSG